METLDTRRIRVCVTGPECTGKTTLAAALAERYGTVWVPEYAREYALTVARPLTAADVEPIARGQMANEDRLAARASGVLILDTDLVSTVVYARYYYGGVPFWIEEEARRRLADLYLLLDCSVPFISDAARDAEEDRPRHMLMFARTLAEFGAPFANVTGGWTERTRRASDIVDALLGSPES